MRGTHFCFDMGVRMSLITADAVKLKFLPAPLTPEQITEMVQIAKRE